MLCSVFVILVEENARSLKADWKSFYNSLSISNCSHDSVLWRGSKSCSLEFTPASFDAMLLSLFLLSEAVVIVYMDGPVKIKLRKFRLKIDDWDQSPHQHEQRYKVKQLLYTPCPEDPLRQQDTKSWECYWVHHSRGDLDKNRGFGYRILRVIHFAKGVD